MKCSPVFSGRENHFVTLAEVNQLTRKYRKAGGKNAVWGGYMSKDAILTLLDQEDAVGVRYYYAAQKDATPLLVWIGTDAIGRDLLAGQSVKVSTTDPVMFKERVVDEPASAYDIPLSEAAVLTGNYRANGFANNVLGGFFGNDAIRRLLGQEKCVGMRFYYGMVENGTRKMVLVGVDVHGADIIHGILLDISAHCPPLCFDENLLNNDRFLSMALAATADTSHQETEKHAA